MKFLLLFFLVTSSFLYGGMAVYIIKDKDLNDIAYRVYMNSSNGYSAHKSLYKFFRNKLLFKDDKKFSQLIPKNSSYSIEDSRDIVTGYYVIIDNGDRFKEHPRYGVGFSTKSSTEAEKNARKDVSINDWSWYSKRHGYKILESGVFPESKCSVAFRKCLNQAKNGAEKKQCAMKKKECQGPTTNKPSNNSKEPASWGVRG